MYRTRRCRIRRKRELWEYSRAICVNSARLYNRANFIIRQYATACRDWEVMKPLRENQLEVYRMVREVTRGTKYEPKGKWLTYGQLDYILKATGDPAYKALPAQANQQILKRIKRDYSQRQRSSFPTGPYRSNGKEDENRILIYEVKNCM